MDRAAVRTRRDGVEARVPELRVANRDNGSLLRSIEPVMRVSRGIPSSSRTDCWSRRSEGRQGLASTFGIRPARGRDTPWNAR